MREAPAGILDALAGSSGSARIQFNAWYDGQPTVTDLPVSNYKADWDITRDIMGGLACTVLDSTGTLSPWVISDKLGVGGAHIQSQLVIGNLSMPLSYQRITKSQPDETWYVAGDAFHWVQNSAEISLEAKDVTVTVQGARFMSAEAPPAGATCVSEIVRLLQGLMDVDSTAVTDKAVPASIVYREDRLAAVSNLADELGAIPRVDPSGIMVLVPRPTVSVWTVQGGVDGSFMKISRSQQIEDFPNAAVSTNTAPDGQSLYGVATQTSGDGYFDGPHGRWPAFHNANFATTQAAIDKDAATTLANLQRKRTIQVPARVVFDPRIEVGDIITMKVPILSGKTGDLPGRVKSLSYAGVDMAPAYMDLILQCQPVHVQAVSALVRASQQYGLR